MWFERILRRVATDFIAYRDGVTGSGSAFRDFQRDARRTPEEMREVATRKLRAQIAHARSTVPYYRKAWEGIDLPMARFQPADLARLPRLNKTILRAHAAELRTSDPSVGPLSVDFTGGTTGTQVSFYRDRACTVQRIGRQRAVLDACGYARGL
jgi:phenylacetate-coenzyme A ligase PaaK-like adenylate-forming protein